MSTSRKAIPADRLAALKARVPMPSLVAETIPVQRAGHGEYLALCPFHQEQTPSFRVYPDHAHCFGCGWHGDPIGWLMDSRRLGFLGAVRHLSEWAGEIVPVESEIEERAEESLWRPIQPVPGDAPELMTRTGRTLRVFNPKRAGERWEYSSCRPAMVHPYRDASGALLGFVLRVVSTRGGKFTPTVTYCENRQGERRWCLVPFTRPLPLYRLDRLAQRQPATVLLVEGEKTVEAAERLFPSLVPTTWPGGSKAYPYADLSPLRGRRVICLPDADQPGREAFIGRRDRRGNWHRGLLELLVDVGAETRLADPEPTRPDGWDIADAEAEGWTTAEAAAWLKSRLAGARHAA